MAASKQRSVITAVAVLLFRFGGANAQQPTAPSSTAPEARAVVEARAPIYMRAALTAGMYGRVVVRVDVSAAGQVQSIALVHAVNPLLDKPASEAANAWRFAPSQVASSALLTFKFVIAEEPSVVFLPPFEIVVSAPRIPTETPGVS